MNVLLYSDIVTGDNRSSAEDIDFLLKKIDISDNNAKKRFIYDSYADTSRDSTRVGLAKELYKLNCTCSLDTFLTATCCHYKFKLMVCLLHKKYFSDEAISNRNII